MPFAVPASVNADMALSKHFKFHERLDAELRLDAFNVFNHVNFGNPNTNIFSPLFGQVSTTQGPTTSNPSGSGGPRVLQIALHFRF
jgi:hypothetical protein